MTERLGKLQKDILCYMKEFNWPIPSGDFIAQLFDTHRDSATRALRKLTTAGYLVQCPSKDVLKGIQGNSKAYMASTTHYAQLISDTKSEGRKLRDQLKSLKKLDDHSGVELNATQAELDRVIGDLRNTQTQYSEAQELWQDLIPKLEANWVDYTKDDFVRMKERALDTASEINGSGKAA